MFQVPFGKPIEEVYSGVHDGPVLGSGASGQVRLVSHKATGLKYAVKCLDLDLVDTEECLQQLREEIYIMCQLDHPNIVRLEEVFPSEISKKNARFSLPWTTTVAASKDSPDALSRRFCETELRR